MKPDRTNQLQIFAVLSILSGTVAYPPATERNSSSSSVEQIHSHQKIVCFISAANRRFDYDALQAGWCTHYILIDLIVLNSEGKLLIIEQSSSALTLFTEFKARIKQVGDPAKFVLAIGGVNQDSAHFSSAVADRARAHRVAENVVAYVQKYCFDGVDVAWFYPGSFGGSEEDKENLVTLLQGLRCRFNNGESVSLTVGVNAQIDTRYNMSQIDSNVDFVNIMSGDYHDPREASHVSALYPGDKENQCNVYSSVKAYIFTGFPPNKIVVLTSTYGYLYSLRIGRQGQEVVKTVQKLSNLCIRDILEMENFFISWDNARMVPYGTLTGNTGRKWITFNDLESHQKKAEFVQKFELAGIGVFTLDQDASSERSGGVPFPFLWALVKVLRPELKFRIFPKTLYDTRTDEQVTKACQGDKEDMLIRYLPNENAQRNGEERVKEETVLFGDVRYQNAPERSICRRYVIGSPPTGNEDTATADETTTIEQTTTVEETTAYEQTSTIEETTTVEEITTVEKTTTADEITTDNETTSTVEETSLAEQSSEEQTTYTLRIVYRNL